MFKRGNYVVGAALLELRCWNCVVRTALLELRCGNCVVGTALWELRCLNCVVGTTLLELRCWNYVVGTTLLELRCWNCVVINQSKTFALGIRACTFAQRAFLPITAFIARSTLLKKETLHNISQSQN